METVGTASPVEDFRTLLKCAMHGQLPACCILLCSHSRECLEGILPSRQELAAELLWESCQRQI